MPFLIYLYIVFQLLIVTFYDIRTRKISNNWSILNIILYAALVFLFPQHYTFTLQTFYWPIGFFIAGFILFILKVMGGGDAKYLASYFLIIPEKLHENTFDALALSTILVGSSVFIKNLFKNADYVVLAWKEKNPYHIKKIFGEKFAYAPVILISWIWLGWAIRKNLY